MSVRVEWDDSQARAIVQNGGAAGVRACAHMLLDEARKQVPLDTGALSRSGTVSSEGLSAVVSFSTPYAIRWHEESANFQRGRKNKYLEDPVNDPDLRTRMLKHLGEGFEF